MIPRQGDRRQGPRREVDRDLHYAKERLIVDALAAAAEAKANSNVRPETAKLDRMVEAADAFLAARDAVDAANREGT